MNETWQDYLKDVDQYLTICPGRKQIVRSHKNLGVAKNSFNAEKEGWIIHSVNGEWKEYGSFFFPQVCPKCKKAVKGKWGWEKLTLPKIQVWEAPAVCHDCYYAMGNDERAKWAAHLLLPKFFVTISTET